MAVSIDPLTIADRRCRVMCMHLYKTDMIRKLASKHRRSQAHYQAAMTEIFEGITEQLGNGHSITLIGFGTFYARSRAEQKLKDIRSGKMLTVPAHHQVAFRAGNELRSAVKRVRAKKTASKRTGSNQLQ
jgi:nucleoid DNA-binding protein